MAKVDGGSHSLHTVLDRYLGHCNSVDIPNEAPKVLGRLETEHKTLLERQRGIRQKIVKLAELSETTVADSSETEENAHPTTTAELTAAALQVSLLQKARGHIEVRAHHEARLQEAEQALAESTAAVVANDTRAHISR
eukprot:CAMPEP_0118944466 /NCGR_PEP_ID=MMETSP1169-20130426/40369_1 /TAXON_ID=36882 /ORGANISM="Pyramimonas obovata, Strain CCMP722" /LENGTH=137 /DNA_ID=CAMNT_0006889963 /DNA_START=100 /DNA_END=509 /DNA_ORIENTATION=+